MTSRRRAVARGRHHHEAGLPAHDRPSHRAVGGRPRHGRVHGSFFEGTPVAGPGSSSRSTARGPEGHDRRGGRCDRAAHRFEPRPQPVDVVQCPGDPDPPRGGRHRRGHRVAVFRGRPSSTWPATVVAGAHGHRQGHRRRVRPVRRRRRRGALVDRPSRRHPADVHPRPGRRARDRRRPEGTGYDFVLKRVRPRYEYDERTPRRLSRRDPGSRRQIPPVDPDTAATAVATR